MEFQAAVVHDDVQELRDVWLDGQRGYPGSAEILGVDHSVRAGPQQFGNGRRIRSRRTLPCR